MTLSVEWVSKHSLYKEPWKDLQEIPVIRVATLLKWIETQDRYDVGLDYLHKQLRGPFAQLPEEG